MNNFRLSPGAYVADQDVPLRNVAHRGQPNTQVQTWLNYKNQGMWPHRWEIVGWVDWDAAVGASFTYGSSSSGISGGNGGWTGADADIGDNVSWYVPCDTGTWSIMVMHPTSSDRGIFDVVLDGEIIKTSMNTYSASPTWNVITTIANIPIVSPGFKTLKFTCTGKSAASTDYGLSFQLITGVRTGN